MMICCMSLFIEEEKKAQAKAHPCSFYDIFAKDDYMNRLQVVMVLRLE